MKQVSDRKIPICLTGMLLPCAPGTDNPQQVILEDIHFVALFTTNERLIQALDIIGLHCDIKEITDGAEFLDSVRGKARIMVDPWITEEGNTRFLEIKLESETT